MSIILANKIGKCLFLSGAIFLLVGFIWAQTPSVEVSLYSEPDLTNLAVVQTENSVKISVRAFDVSGIYNVVAIISDSRGDEKERVILYDDGNHDDGTAGDTIYGNSVLLVGYPPGVFWISLFAIDNFAFRKDVVRVVSFELVSNCKIAVPENASAQTQFEIDVSESPGSDRISQARFSSDDSQDETASGVWTDWFDWTGSSGDWDSARKIMKWSLNEAGDYEIWAEIKDTASNVFSCFDTTRVQANCQTSEGLTICLNVVTTGFSETQILSFASDKPLVSSGDTIDLSAVLRYRFGETIAGEKINFVDTTDSLILCPAVLTNDQGVASCSYQIPLTMTRQFHVLKAEYLGSCVLGTNPSQNSSVSITVANAIPSVIAVLITPSPNAFSHETLVCSFIVSDSDTTDVLSADITWEKRANAGASWTAWVSDDETINSVPNGVSRSTSSAGNIEPADTNYEEQWRCKATGRDNQGGASEPRYSDPVTIASATVIDPFTANNTQFYPGETVNLSATLKYQTSGNPIQDENLTFINTFSGATMCANRNTNGQGEANCNYQIPSNAARGSHIFKAQYVGNKTILAESSENSSLTITVLNKPPTIIAVLITPSPNAFSHETLVCSFIVSDSDTTDVLSADITWEKRANAGASWTAWVSDDETINSVPNGVSRSTSSAGNIEPADTNYEEQWRCKATGRDNQGGASASVYSQPVVIASQTKIDPFTANKTNVASGDTINLSATLKYQVSNNPINNENLNFLIGADQTCGNRKTNGQGKADCSYNIPYKNCYCRGSSLICDNPLSGSGNKTLKAQYLGNRSLLAEPVENSSLSLLVNIISTGPTECGPVCGDRSCERGETCDVCPADCGPCGPVCGNGICEPGEDWLSCPADPCPAPYCGDGNCDRGEDCTWCWDCGWCWPEPHGVPFWLF